MRSLTPPRCLLPRNCLKNYSFRKATGIVCEGTLADFEKVKLVPNGEKEARRYLEAEPGSDLNLGAQEIAGY